MMKKLTTILFYLIFLLAFSFSAHAGLVIGSGAFFEGGSEEGCTWDILDENCTDISDWDDMDTFTAVSEVDPAGYFRFDTNSGAGNETIAERERDIGSYPDQFSFQIEAEFDTLGTITSGDHAAVYCYQADEYFRVQFGTEGLYIRSGSNNDEVGTNLVKHGGNSEAQNWRFLIDFTGANGTGVCDVYLDDSTHNWGRVGTGVPCSTAAVRTNGRTRVQQRGDNTNDMVAHVNNVKIATGLCIGTQPPTVTTQAVDGIHDNNATGHGTITATGGENATKRGICWDTAPMPTIDDYKAEDSGSFGVGAFSKLMTELSANTTYYVRAYAPNSSGYSYGDQVDFNSSGSPPPGCSCYVDTGGDDGSGNGTSGNPWLTVGYALGQSNFGETVCCNDGTYNEAQLTVPAGVSLISTSTNASKVTIQPNVNMGLDIPFVKLETASPGSDGNQTISYVTLDGDTGTYTCRWGISIKNRNNVIITRCDIKDFTSDNKSHGIYVLSTQIDYNSNWDDYWPADPQAPETEINIDALWPGNPVENFELSYCNITNCGYRGSLSSGSMYAAIKPFNLKNSTIHHNTINTEDSLGPPIKATCAFMDNVDVYNNDLTMAYYTDTASWTIELWVFRRGCEVYDNTSNGMFSITVGKETKIHDNVIIATWESSPQRGAGIEFILQNEGEIYNNYIEKAGDYGIVLGLASHSGNENRVVRNIKIYNNIIYNAYSCSVFVQNRNSLSGNYTVENIEVYNNTCDDLTRTHISSGLLDVRSQQLVGIGTVTTDNVSIMNNICTNSPGYAGKTLGTITNLTIDYNLFYSNNTNDWSGSTDTNSVIDNPDINGTGAKPGPWYYLQSVSPARDAGTNSVNSTVTDDYWGTVRDASIDIGAHEYVP